MGAHPGRVEGARDEPFGINVALKSLLVLSRGISGLPISGSVSPSHTCYERDSCEGENTFFLLVTRYRTLVRARGKLRRCVAPKRCPPWSCSPAQPAAGPAVCPRPADLQKAVTSCLLPTGCSWIHSSSLHPLSLGRAQVGCPHAGCFTLGTVAPHDVGAVAQLLTLCKSTLRNCRERTWVVLMFLLLSKLKTDALVQIAPVDLSGRLVGAQTLRIASLGDFLFSFCCSEHRCIQRLPLNMLKIVSTACEIRDCLFELSFTKASWLPSNCIPQVCSTGS